MGCFLACFGACKCKKHKHLVNAAPPGDRRDGGSEALRVNNEVTKKEGVVPEEAIKHAAESEGKAEKKLSCNKKKKVTFDPNVKAYEPSLATDKGVADKEEKGSGNEEKPTTESESLSYLIQSDEVASYPPYRRYGKCYNHVEYEDLDLVDNDLDDDEDSDDKGGSGDDDLVQEESSESLFSLSIDSRKQGDEGSRDRVDVQEVSSESLFSLSIDSKKQESGAELGEKEVTSSVLKCDSPQEEQMCGSDSFFSISVDSRTQMCEVELVEKEVSSPMRVGSSPIRELKPVGSNHNARDRSQFVDSVLNPIEYLPQGKGAKARASLPLQQQDKENINLEQDLGIGISREPSFKLFTNTSKVKASHKKPADQEITVDTSLSSWLVGSETSQMSNGSAGYFDKSPSGRKTSSGSHEDRQFLRASTVREDNKVSASISPRRSRRQTSDESPAVGTVGSYWSHTGWNLDSDSGSSSKGTPITRSKNAKVCVEPRYIVADKKVKQSPTAHGTRLEVSLERGTAQV